MLPFVFYFLVYLVNPSGVPERANNPLSFILMISFVVMACHLSFYLPGILPFKIHTAHKVVLVCIFTLTIFFSKNFLTAIQDQFSAPIYSSIYDSRVKKIDKARRLGKKSVDFNSYQKEWEEYIQKNIPAMFYKPMTKLVNPYPQTIFFCDDVENSAWITSYAEYYDIDTIRVDGAVHLRFELDENARRENNGFK